MASAHPAPDSWRNAAAFVTWVVVGLPVLADLLWGRFSGPPAVLWIVAFVLFGAALVPALGMSRVPQGAVLLAALLVLQSAAGLLMVATSGSATIAATLVIVAAAVASHFGPRVAWTWVALQSASTVAVFARFDSFLSAFALGGAFAGFQAFAVATISLAESERVAREESARAHAELLATRALLAENSRISERVRIARDLHDTLGHHLTALSLQLDVAARLTTGQAVQHLQEAHAIAKLLLSDVRNVVSMTRDSQLDLTSAVRALTGVAGPLRIHLEMPESLAIDDASQAHALLRCVQEIITNAMRHAAARNLWIRMEPTAAGIGLRARDDGRGAAPVVWGSGLRGMRERFEEHAGRVEVSSTEGGGFEVHGFMPRAEAAS